MQMARNCATAVMALPIAHLAGEVKFFGVSPAFTILYHSVPDMNELFERGSSIGS
jgi:hypothetical protein